MDHTFKDYAPEQRPFNTGNGFLKKTGSVLGVAFAAATLGGVFTAALDRAELVTDTHAISEADMATKFEPLSMNDPGHPMVDIYQKRLIRAGYLDHGTADGVFGPATATATLHLQKDLGVQQTGVADSTTQSLLHNLIQARKAAPKAPAP